MCKVGLVTGGSVVQTGDEHHGRPTISEGVPCNGYLSILIHDMKPEDLRLSCIHILIIPHAKLKKTHRKASSYESHLSWGYVVVVPNHRILQFCGIKSFFSLPFANFFFVPFAHRGRHGHPCEGGLRERKMKPISASTSCKP